ncbi:peptide deformylase, mitochondrial [Ornithorhynchus anatinus]|uniref:Peptide deformylase n=1 Tax=Ornithorhynchus anatinus TaxID=9258 RepID=A0A6I8N3I4_ORNAN|nr:peptide deformylase, mitochondrial [Ornithorhynchus anatinus]
MALVRLVLPVPPVLPGPGLGGGWGRGVGVRRCGSGSGSGSGPAAPELPGVPRSTWRWLRRLAVGAPRPPFVRVCQVGDPVLRAVAAPVEAARLGGPEVRALVGRLVRVMRSRGAVGLSAPQLGLPLQVLVMEFPDSAYRACGPRLREARRLAPFPLKVFVNPSLRVLDARLDSQPEGCESIAGFSAHVPRFRAVRIEGLDENGEPVVWQASGWPARIIQHEMDHLQGSLYIDKMDSRTFTNVRWMEVND